MLGIDFERVEASAAAGIELAEEFDELQSVRMNICAERVDADIQRVTDHKDDGEKDDTENGIAHHTADLVEYLRDDAGCQPQSQQTAVGQDIAEITGGSVKTVHTL